jgi:hypothetical protein
LCPTIDEIFEMYHSFIGEWLEFVAQTNIWWLHM